VRVRRAVELTTVSDRPSAPGRHNAGLLRTYAKVDGQRHRIMLSGELDVASAQLLDAMLDDACSEGARELVLDLGGIEFMDSEGLNAILRGKARCEERGCRYSVTPAQRPAQRVMDATGVSARLFGSAG
jgi:anti-sigma B factor antagonist